MFNALLSKVRGRKPVYNEENLVDDSLKTSKTYQDRIPDLQKLLDDFIAANITISTVLIAGHGSGADVRTMKAIAEYTGGTFCGPIKNPKKLPAIFIKEAEFV